MIRMIEAGLEEAYWMSAFSSFLMSTLFWPETSCSISSRVRVLQAEGRSFEERRRP